MIGETILLKHIGGEEKALPVEFVCATYVSVRWGQSGIYDLNLAKNVLTARSQKAQRKGKAHWSAVCIEGVRKMVEEHLNEEYEVNRQLFSAHQRSMPR